MSFALLADPTRVRMLWALRDTELDVSSLAAIAECRPTVASQHLSKLRFAGLVEGHRHGPAGRVPPPRRPRPRPARRSPLPRRPPDQRHARPRLARHRRSHRHRGDHNSFTARREEPSRTHNVPSRTTTHQATAVPDPARSDGRRARKSCDRPQRRISKARSVRRMSARALCMTMRCHPCRGHPIMPLRGLIRSSRD